MAVHCLQLVDCSHKEEDNDLVVVLVYLAVVVVVVCLGKADLKMDDFDPSTSRYLDLSVLGLRI